MDLFINLEVFNLKKEISCGCIIINDKQILLVHEKNANFWGFPKGHIEFGETEIETALREVKEEIGIDVNIISTKKYSINYIINDEIDKTSIFYIASPKTLNITKQESEIDDVKWCSYEEALSTLTFDNLKDLLKQIFKDL